MPSDAPNTTADASSSETANASAPLFSFRLEPEVYGKSIYEKVNCREFCNLKQVHGFIKHHMGISYDGVRRYEHLPYKTEEDQVVKYKDAWNRRTQCFATAHVLAKHKCGRITPSGSVSLSVFHRPTRHALAEASYVDMDMVNAHPDIYAKVAAQHGISKPMLRRYAADPKHYRAQIMEHYGCSKDVAKRLPIMLLFGGTYGGWMKEHNIREESKLPEFVELEREMRELIEIVWANNQDTIYKDVVRQNKHKWKNAEEAKRGVMGLWGQTVERLLQEHCISWLVEHKGFKLADIVPCQDGMMILKELYYEGIEADLEAAMASRFGFSVRWLKKPFDEAIEIPEWGGSKTLEEWQDQISVKPLADAFLGMYARYLARQDGRLFVFAEDAHGGRWYDETDEKERHRLTIYLSENLFESVHAQIVGDVGLSVKDRDSLLRDLRNNTCRGSSMKDILRHVFSKVRNVEGLFNQKPYLFPFHNGVYELLTGEFRPHRYDDYLTLTCGWDWEPLDYEQEEHRANMALLRQVVAAIDDREDHQLFKLQTLASGLDGRAYQLLHYWVGAGGNGKSLLLSLLASVLGKHFYYQAPPGLSRELSRPNGPSPDAYNLLHKRWVNFTEVSGVISLSVLRTLTGGGAITARLLNSNPVAFYPTCTYSMEFNNPPTYDCKPQQADYRRAMLHRFPTCFTSASKHPERIGKTVNGVVWREANPYYESEAFKLLMRPYFFDLLAGIYRQHANERDGLVLSVPKSAKEETEQFVDDQNLFQKVFKTYYERVKWTEADWTPKNPAMMNLGCVMKFKTFWEAFGNSEEFRALRTNAQRAEYSRDNCYAWLRDTFETKVDKAKVEWVRGVAVKYQAEDGESEA